MFWINFSHFDPETHLGFTYGCEEEILSCDINIIILLHMSRMILSFTSIIPVTKLCF